MDDILAFVIKAIAIIFVVGVFVIGYEQIRYFVVGIYRYIKSEAEKKKRDESSQ